MVYKIKSKKRAESKSFPISNKEVDYFIENSSFVVTESGDKKKAFISSIDTIGELEQKGISAQRRNAMEKHIEKNYPKYRKRLIG